MRHLGVLLSATLLSAACASNPPPPAAASSDSVAQATNQPNVGPDFTPASQDGVAAAERTTPAPSRNSNANARPNTPPNPGTNDNGTWGGGNEGSAATEPSPGNAAAAPMDNSRAPVAPDNTRINSRDGNGSGSLTPMDQGPSPADRKMTQQIRQEVMKDKTLSFTAKNVKIITINGKVTLRGPVKSEAERTAIEAAARRVAGSGASVDSQIELAQ